MAIGTAVEKAPESSAEQAAGNPPDKHYSVPHCESYRDEVLSGRGCWGPLQNRQLETMALSVSDTEAPSPISCY